MHFELLDELVIIFLLSIVVNLVCNKIKLTATVGFLLTGVLCGPSLLGIVDSQSISDVAELGVAMLLFTIGMELSGEALSRLKRPVFLGGSLQIGLTVLAIAGLTALLDGTSLPSGIFWGCLVALSSSAIVLQIFQQKGLTSTPTGRLSLAILVFQDIMVAPMMLCVPLLSGQFHMAPLDMLLSVLKVGGILGAVLLAAHLHGSGHAHPLARAALPLDPGHMFRHGTADPQPGPFPFAGRFFGGPDAGPFPVQHERHLGHHALP